MTSQKEFIMAKWTEPLTNELISLLVVEVKKGNRTTSTYNKKGWKNVHVEFNKRTGLHYSIFQLKNRVNKLRRQYGSFKKLLSQFGFGWDHINNKVAVEDESLWESHIKDNREWAKFRQDGFPQYPDLCIVFGDTYAIGEYVEGNAEQVVLSSEEDDNSADGGDVGFDVGADAIRDPKELDECHIDGLFTPDVISYSNHRKHNIDRTPNSKRSRKSTTAHDISNTCKAIQKLIAFRTSQSTSGSVTSNVPSHSSLPVDPYSIGAVVAVLNGMPNLEQDLYNKAVNQSCLNAIWREAFILSLPERRRGLLESL